MADTKISALTAVASVAGANEFAVNEAGTSKKATATQIQTFAISAANLVKNDQGNTYSTGAQDLTSATSLIVPTSAGYAPTADGSLGYDSTQDAWVGGGAGAIKGFIPRVVYMSNSTTEGNQTTQANTAGTGGNQDDAAGTAGTSELIFASKWSMPANFLTTNKAIRILAVFQITSSATSPTTLIKLKLGSTDVVSHIASAMGSSLTTRGFSFSWVVQGTAVPGASVSVQAGYENFVSPGVGNANFVNTVAQPVAGIATNGALAVQISMTWGAATAGNTLQLNQLYVMELN